MATRAIDAPDPAHYNIVEDPDYRPPLLARIFGSSPKPIGRLPWDWSQELQIGWNFIEAEQAVERAGPEILEGARGASHVSVWWLPWPELSDLLRGDYEFTFSVSVATFGADGIDLRTARTEQGRLLLADHSDGRWYVPNDTDLAYGAVHTTFLPYAGLGKTVVTQETIRCDATDQRIRAPRELLDDPVIRMRLNTRRLISAGR